MSQTRLKSESKRIWTVLVSSQPTIALAQALDAPPAALSPPCCPLRSLCLLTSLLPAQSPLRGPRPLVRATAPV
eukprot:6411820-Prymnesium_polylepis.2